MSTFKNILQIEIKDSSKIREIVEQINTTLKWLKVEKIGESSEYVGAKHKTTSKALLKFEVYVGQNYQLGLAFESSKELIQFLNWLQIITNFEVVDLKVFPD